MKILITGAAGFIGYHLSKSIIEDGDEVLGIDSLNSYYDTNLKKARLKILNAYDNFSFEKIDIANKQKLEAVFKKFAPQKVVNLAAQAGVRFSISNPYDYMNSNLVGFLNIIELCRHGGVEGLVYASSSSIYGNNKKIPFSETHKAKNPISLYGATKRSNELIANVYSHLYNLKITGLRYFTVYGPWYRPDMAMYIFIRNIFSKKPITLYNNGNMKRDFTFIDDVISGTKAALNKNYKNKIFNIGNSKSEKLMDMVSIIEDEIGIKALINYAPMQPGDVKNTFADIKLSREKLNYNPKTKIKVGIPKLVNWYKKYHNV